MNILYICFKGEGVDGGTIYDKNFRKGIEFHAHSVDLFEVDRRKSSSWPRWLSSIDKNLLDELKAKSCLYDKVICSHEGLANVLSVIKVDLFIVHNVFSIFHFQGNALLNLFYRLGSKRIYEKILKESVSVLCLSKKEELYIQSLKRKLNLKTNIIREPPGLKIEEANFDFDFNKVKISGTYDWYPKKISKINSEEVRFIESKFQIVKDESFTLPSFALIEERFVVGFKLKLMQMIYRKDVIASFCDLSLEVQTLVPDFVQYKTVNNAEEAVEFFDKFKDEVSIDKCDLKFRLSFEQQYKWSSICSRILNELDY